MATTTLPPPSGIARSESGFYDADSWLPLDGTVIELGFRKDNVSPETLRRLSELAADYAAGTLSCARRAGADQASPSAVDDAMQGGELLLTLSIALRGAAENMESDAEVAP